MEASTLTTCLWFDTEAQAAAEFYCQVFPDGRIGDVSRYGEVGPGQAGTVITVEFTIFGQHFVALNGGPQFHIDEAVSFQIPCADQAEVDHYWTALTADGGAESQCGWCKDKFGVSWQVIPTELPRILGDPDPGRSQRAMAAMLQMRKLDLAALRAAADDA